MTTEKFDGEILVASRIIDYLSSGLYHSPSACLKELINNSFDADATTVNVFVKPDANRIIIEDNGCGMDKKEFEKNFKKISESHKRDQGDKTSRGRSKIGKIGIGFIAANEICDVMEIVSTKEGSAELIEVEIRFDLMRQPIPERRRGDTDIAKGDYHGSVSKTDEAAHYTHVFLKNIRGDARAILAGPGSTDYSAGNVSLYGLTADSIRKHLQEKMLRSWSEFDAYSKNMLEIGLNVPVCYHDHWIPKHLNASIKQIESQVKKLEFSLAVDGVDIRKPIVFPQDVKCIIEPFSFKGKNVSAHGYFYAQHGAIHPQELQGLLIRIRNAAIGEYDQSFLNFSPSIGALFQSWISAEIIADDGLEDAMNIDRRTLRIAHPAYVELQRAIHDKLAEVLKRTRLELYIASSQERNATKAKDIQTKVLNMAKNDVGKLTPDAARIIKRTWEKASTDEHIRKRLLRKYSVDEFYQIVMEVAEEVLSPKQALEFISKLSERLRK